MKKLLVLAGLLVAFSGSTTAQELRASPADAKSLVKTAVAYLKNQGREKAFKEFQNPNGPFIYRDLYIFVYDLRGKCVAHGADQTRVGKDLIDAKDPDGKTYVRERIEIAKTRGFGWQDYKFKNPINGKIENKTAFVERAEDLIVGSGAYK